MLGTTSPLAGKFFVHHLYQSHTVICTSELPVISTNFSCIFFAFFWCFFGWFVNWWAMTFWKVATAAPRKLSPDQITALIKISNALGEESKRLQATQHLMLSSPCFLKMFMWPPFRNWLAGAHNCCPILVSWRTVWVCGHIWPSILRCHDDTAKTSCTAAVLLLHICSSPSLRGTSGSSRGGTDGESDHQKRHQKGWWWAPSVAGLFWVKVEWCGGFLKWGLPKWMLYTGKSD